MSTPAPSLEELLRQAWERRAPLREDPRTTAYRLVNGEPDGLPGVTVDGFERVHVMSLCQDFSPAQELALLDAAEVAWAPHSLYLKRRPKEARHLANVAKEQLAPEVAARGESVESLVALENGL